MLNAALFDGEFTDFLNDKCHGLRFRRITRAEFEVLNNLAIRQGYAVKCIPCCGREGR